MTNLALVVNNNKEQQEQGREVVKADVDNGYYRVANELGLALCKVRISDRESRLVHAVMMKTFGFNKSMDWVCNAQLSELTNIDEKNISRVKKSLKKRNILLITGKKIGVNTVVSEWVLSEEIDKKPSKLTAIKNRQFRREKPSGLTSKTVKNVNLTVSPDTHNRQDTNTKDTNTKDNNKLVLPFWLPFELWSEFVAMRKLIKKPLTDQATVRMINKLVKFHAQGVDAIAQLTYSIDNCYSDVYAPKNHQNNTFRSKSTLENFNDKDYGETQIPIWMQGETS